MARLQDQNFEHQNVIVGRSAALRPIAPGRGALKIGSKDLKIDDLIEPLKIVALRGNVPQTFVDIKKSRVSDHPTIPSETRKGNHKSTLTAAAFGGVQPHWPVGAKSVKISSLIKLGSEMSSCIKPRSVDSTASLSRKS